MAQKGCERCCMERCCEGRHRNDENGGHWGPDVWRFGWNQLVLTNPASSKWLCYKMVAVAARVGICPQDKWPWTQDFYTTVLRVTSTIPQHWGPQCHAEGMVLSMRCNLERCSLTQQIWEHLDGWMGDEWGFLAWDLGPNWTGHPQAIGEDQSQRCGNFPCPKPLGGGVVAETVAWTDGFEAKNLGEVTLRKGVTSRSQAGKVGGHRKHPRSLLKTLKEIIL